MRGWQESHWHCCQCCSCCWCCCWTASQLSCCLVHWLWSGWRWWWWWSTRRRWAMRTTKPVTRSTTTTSWNTTTRTGTSICRSYWASKLELLEEGRHYFFLPRFSLSNCTCGWRGSRWRCLTANKDPETCANESALASCTTLNSSFRKKSSFIFIYKSKKKL